MTGNRLIERRAVTTGGEHEHCPAGYSDPQAWCDWRNREMTREGLRWSVGTSGTPVLGVDPEWSAAQRKRDAIRAEEERRRFNHRQNHPLSGN